MEIVIGLLLVFAAIIISRKFKKNKVIRDQHAEAIKSHFSYARIESIGMRLIMIDKIGDKKEMSRLNEHVGAYILSIEMAQGVPLRGLLDVYPEELSATDLKLYNAKMQKAYNGYAALVVSFANKADQESRDVDVCWLAASLLQLTVGSSLCQELRPHTFALWSILQKGKKLLPPVEEHLPGLNEAFRYVPIPYAA